MSTSQQSSAVVVHGGAGGSREHEDGCVRAAERALDELGRGGDALAAAVAAVMVLEDDGRFNAGSGSVLCLDGATIEMDASIMDSRGRLGAIACVRSVKNPVLLARAVADTPHCLLAGEGAQRFARALGLPADDGISDTQRQAHRKLMTGLAGSVPAMPGVDNKTFARLWNYKSPLQLPAGTACDTVGAVVRDAGGHFAVAGSTGGAAPSLLGRVGDTPIIGSGFYAGPIGAVAATGIGEHIMHHMLAHAVYRWLEEGMALKQALKRGIDLFDGDIDVGLIAVTRTEAGFRSNRDMPTARMINQ